MGLHLFIRRSQEVRFGIDVAQHFVGRLGMEKEKIAMGAAYDRGLEGEEGAVGACAVAYRTVHGLILLGFAHLNVTEKARWPATPQETRTMGLVVPSILRDNLVLRREDSLYFCAMIVAASVKI
jgi:hypothetical protein